MQVIAVMMDNASNNDALMSYLEAHHHAAGYTDFDTEKARMRCMPHMIHLAALKVRAN